MHVVRRLSHAGLSAGCAVDDLSVESHKIYARGRSVHCPTKLNIYTKGTLCHACDRKRRVATLGVVYRSPPKGRTKHPGAHGNRRQKSAAVLEAKTQQELTMRESTIIQSYVEHSSFTLDAMLDVWAPSECLQELRILIFLLREYAGDDFGRLSMLFGYGRNGIGAGIRMMHKRAAMDPTYAERVQKMRSIVLERLRSV